MIIVSQDKTEIVNFNNIESVWISKEEEGIFSIEATADTNASLGEYQTEERAKEVLEEIVESYTNWNNLVCGQPTGECTPKYEMPKE